LVFDFTSDKGHAKPLENIRPTKAAEIAEINVTPLIGSKVPVY
jgi:hypothetical protein